jgi:alginate O-acetyltransferase complex protein AlgI
MLFNSDIFLKFFSAFLLGYFLVRNHLKLRNLLIVIASYLFYGWWDYRFLGLLLVSSLLDYFVGLALERTRDQRRRKLLVALSVTGGLTILGFFKYYDFFVESLAQLLASFNLPIQLRTLNILLPVGISFYTFQSMSYAIDVYRREITATRDLVNFLAFVSFFPQLVAGPIERARHLLPQFERVVHITGPMLAEGLWLTLWGMFKKVVLADNLAPLVDLAFEGSVRSGPVTLLGVVAFGFQIYCDFSGYSDIARGTAKILGFDIMINFDLPYGASNLREFWRRWHISFSTWLRDYVYISLGGNRRGPLRTHLNLLATMFLGGLWHGAAWHFVLWGLWHGLGLMLQRTWRVAFPPPRLRSNITSAEGLGGGRRWQWVAPIGRGVSWLITMGFVFYGWLLFRAASLKQVAAMTLALDDFSVPDWGRSYLINLFIFTLPLVGMEIWLAKTGNRRAPLALSAWPKAVLHGALLIGILLYWEKEKMPFIYFQF